MVNNCEKWLPLSPKNFRLSIITARNMYAFLLSTECKEGYDGASSPGSCRPCDIGKYKVESICHLNLALSEMGWFMVNLNLITPFNHPILMFSRNFHWSFKDPFRNLYWPEHTFPANWTIISLKLGKHSGKKIIEKTLLDMILVVYVVYTMVKQTGNVCSGE